VYPLGFTGAEKAALAAGEPVRHRAPAGDDEILVLLNAGDNSLRFPIDVAGFAVAETPGPGARPDDSAEVPGYSWVILGI
jgi:hypothetical protein